MNIFERVARGLGGAVQIANEVTPLMAYNSALVPLAIKAELTGEPVTIPKWFMDGFEGSLKRYSNGIENVSAGLNGAFKK